MIWPALEGGIDMAVTRAPEGLNEEAQYDYFIDLASKASAPIEALQRRDDGTEHLLTYQPGAKQASREIQIGEDAKVDSAGNVVFSELQQAALAERSAIPVSGTPTGVTESFYDASRGVQRVASPGKVFELYEGGGVREVDAKPLQEPTKASSLFAQPTEAGKPTSGFVQENLGLAAAEGKTIKRTGQTVFNPATGSDVTAGPGEIVIEYEDGSFEVRKHGDINTPGQPKPVSEAGKTAQELGITRQTEIKGEQGQITKAPQSAAEALAAAKTPEEMDAVIQAEGLISTANLEFIGSEYTDQETGVRRIAKPGNGFYQEPGSDTILERSIALQGLAKQTTSPSVLAERAQ